MKKCRYQESSVREWGLQTVNTDTTENKRAGRMNDDLNNYIQINQLVHSCMWQRILILRKFTPSAIKPNQPKESEQAVY